MIDHTKIELKPCAHCGDTNVKLVRKIDDNTAYWHVECVGCGMRTGSYEEDAMPLFNSLHADTVFQAMEEAIGCAVMTWNTRKEG